MSEQELLGARRIALIGRDEILNKVVGDYSEAYKPTLWYFEGDGGIGKTVLLEAIRTRAQKIWRSGEISPLVDLYHVDYQSPQGLASRLAEILPHSSAFAGVRKKLRLMEELYNSHQQEKGDKAWEDAQKSLWMGINGLAKRRLMLLFDTTEILAVLMGEQEDDTGEPNVGEWFFRQLLPHLEGRVFIVLAGRPRKEITQYVTGLRQHGWKVHIPNQLPPLSESQCKDYMIELAKMLEEQNYQREAKKIRGYINSYGSQYLHRGTQGKPLRLAMVADILQAGGRLPDYFYGKGNISTEQDLDDVLIEHLRGLASPLGEVLRALGYLPKGGDARLLADLLGATEDDIRPVLEKSQHLTLVKYRPNFPLPYFLHDEIYMLFARYLPIKDIEERQRKAAIIRKRYKAELDDLARKIRDYQAQRLEYGYRKRVVDVELIHYAAWVHPLNGFSEYHVRAMEAAEMRDPIPFLLLNHQIRRSLDFLEESGQQDTREAGEYLRWSRRLRFTERQILFREKEYADIEKQISIWQEENKPAFSQADLLYVTGVLHIKQTDLEKAKETLEEALAQVEAIQNTNKHLDLALTGLKAWIANYQGYINRLEGKYAKAVKNYQKAAAEMRKAHLKGLSSVLTNLAYAQIMMGWTKNSRKVILEAVEEARRQLNVRDEGRALNVRAIIETRAGFPEKGLQYGRQALDTLDKQDEILRSYVHINMARALRYTWNSRVVENANDLWDSVKETYLLPALAHLEGKERLQKIFGEQKTDKIYALDRKYLPIKGAIRLAGNSKATKVEAYGEAGCVWRELAWVELKRARRAEAANDMDSKQQYMYLSRKYSQETENRLLLAALGRIPAGGITPGTVKKWKPLLEEQIKSIGGSPYLPALALTNLGWHKHYQRESPETIATLCAQVEVIIGEEYLWKQKSYPLQADQRDDAEVLRWAVLGKMEMLRAHEALRCRHDSASCKDERDCIYEAARHATLALEYDYLVGSSAYDLQRAEDGLDHRLQNSPDWATDLLPVFYKAALEVQSTLKRPEKSPERYSGPYSKLVRVLKERFGPPEMWVDRGREEAR